MWNTKSKGSTDITMTEGDFGVSLPFEIHGITIDVGDTILFTVKKEKNGKVVLEKNFTKTANDNSPIHENTLDLILTESETDDLKIGTYVYTLDWYKGSQFMYCLVNNAKLKVEDKS